MLKLSEQLETADKALGEFVSGREGLKHPVIGRGDPGHRPKIEKNATIITTIKILKFANLIFVRTVSCSC